MLVQLARKNNYKHCVPRFHNSIVYVQKMGLYARTNDLHYTQQMGYQQKAHFYFLPSTFGSFLWDFIEL